MALAATIVLGGASLAGAQASRTWVSGVGDDANPCSRTAPCKTFAGAITKTQAGGEIDALDPGGFGAVTITKAITIDGSGTLASVLVSGTNGIVINAGPTDVVTLRGVAVQGIGAGLSGIAFLGGGSLHVESGVVQNFTVAGINFAAAGNLFVKDTVVRNSGASGIIISPASGVAHGVLDGVRSYENHSGVQVAAGSLVTVRNADASGNAAEGFWADGAGTELNIQGSSITMNATGIRASNAATVRLTDVTVTNNTGKGLLAESGARLFPFLDNQIASNPPGASGGTCDIPGGTTDVACPAAPGTCPTPVCQAPLIQAALGPCQHCRTRRGVTTCSRCQVVVR